MIVAHNIDLDFECEGQVYKRAYSYYVENFKVSLFGMDVTKILSKNDLESLEEAYVAEYVTNLEFEGIEIKTIA